MAEENLNTVFQIQRIYLKDLSLEQPNSPGLLLEMTAPKVDNNLGVGAETISEDHYEVVLTATVTAKIGDKVLFLVEAKQAGIFEIKNVPKEQMQPVVSIVCPGIIYPYL
jgi:preprotein translocase subunit SecB